MKRKIANALISVSDKSDLGKIAKVLKKYNINIISSGGTFKYLKKMKIKCREISHYTEFKEMLDGRVKTLHPKIHSGILFDRSKKKHIKQMRKNNFEPVDLVVVNFYPFKETIEKIKAKSKIIEKIDIGGPSMVRAAAKNFKDVVIITSKKDYEDLIKELKRFNGKTTLAFREKMACKAFGITAYYDSIIADWFNNELNINFPEIKTFYGKKINQLRYGENPHQKGSVYTYNGKNDLLNQGKLSGKELSYNNYNDIHAGLEILFSDNRLPTTVIIKHANPCGVATHKSPIKSFLNAQASDPVSAFGGIVVCNFKLTEQLAKIINKTFFEVIIAKGFNKKSLKILKKKKNMRIIDVSKINYKMKTNLKYFGNTFLLQENDNIVLDKKKLKCVTKIKPNAKEIREMIFAFKVCKYVKSNAIVIVNDNATIGIGAGQQNRLESCKIAIQKAKKFQPSKLNNSVAASDAFFPFADGIKTLINSGVKLIVQPGGSIRDKEVIDAANKAKIKMIFTNVRHFNH